MDEHTRYERGAELGWGGMGRVLAAHDRRLDREVALKEVVASAPSGSATSRRLAREAAITARLDHPGIVPVFDAGVGPDGALYYTMRLIRGRTLGQALADCPDLPARLGLLRHFLDTCEAMAFAHSLGVLHRDLKPANVMVGRFGETQVMDWGLARDLRAPEEAVGSSGELAPGATHAGALIGTPGAMSPEQARGEEAGAPADVWGLGVILWELLAGRPPLAGSSVEEMLERTRAGALPSLSAAAPDAPPELVAIADKALQLAPEDRYPTAQELARDVAAYIDGRLVGAHAYTPADHLRRLVRAWRAPLAVSGAAALILLVVAGVAWQRNTRERLRAEAAEEATADALRLADRRLGRSLAGHAARAERMGAWPEAEVLAAHSLRLHEGPEARGVLAAVGAVTPPEPVESWDRPCAGGRLLDGGERILCFEGGETRMYLRGRAEPRWSLPDHGRWLRLLGEGAFARLTTDRVLELRSIEDGALSWSLLRSEGFHALAVRTDAAEHLSVITPKLLRRFSPEGEGASLPICGAVDATAASPWAAGWLVACDDDSLQALDAGGAVLWSQPLPVPASEYVTALTPRDDEQIHVGTNAGRVLLMRRDGLAAPPITSDTGVIVKIRPLGDRVVVATERGGLRVALPRAGVWTERFPRDATSFAADDDHVVTLGDRVVRWRLDPEAPVAGLGGTVGLTAARLSPAGDALVTAGGDGSVRVHALPSGRLGADLGWQGAVVKDAAFSRDGSLLAATSARGGTRVFRRSDGATLLDYRVGGRRLAALGERFMLVGYGVQATALLAPSGANRAEHGLDEPLFDLAAHPDGRAAVALGERGSVVFLDSEAQLLRTARFEDAQSVAVPPDGSALLVGTREGLRRFDPDTGDVFAYPGLSEPVLDVAISPDGRRVAGSTASGAVRVWELESGEPLLALLAHTGRVVSVEFSPDGQDLWTASWDGRARRLALGELAMAPEALVARAEARWGLDPDDAVDALAR